jgi:hypothetical protein
VGRRISAPGGEAERCRDAGDGAGVRWRGRPVWSVEGEGELEVGDEPDRWAPPVGGCVRERGREAGACGPAWAKSGRRGRNWAGVTGPRRVNRKGKKKRGRWAGPRVEVR